MQAREGCELGARRGCVVALLGEGNGRLRGSGVRRTGAEEWVALLEVPGMVYRVHLARPARRDHAWSWEITPACA